MEHHSRSSTSVLLLIFLVGTLAGLVTTYYITSQQIINLKGEVSNLEAQISKLWGNQTVYNQNITIYQNSTALSALYQRVKDSVVLIYGTISNRRAVQGSGFVYNFSNTMVVITNYHVVYGTTSISVTFSNGDGYAATVNGTDPYADLAVLTVNAPKSEFRPLQIVSSSTLRVGDSVIAIGNPYGLVGSMTTGVVSALNRTIIENYTGGFSIANIIQTSTPINPGNSGGPLLNYLGNVVGITTAIVADSQGLGFAIPSNTIRREIYSLVVSGGYTGHSYLGLRGTDMSYETAQQLGVNVTYGWRVAEVIANGPSSNAGVRVGDIIIAINGSRIRNSDDMSSYLEENTLPGETIVLTIIRGQQKLDVQVVLGQRPPP